MVKQDGEVAFENYKFPKEDGDGGQILKSNGSGQLTWTDANITYQCPSGYEEVFNFCIEGDPNTAGKQNLQTAIETCALDGGQVPTYQQFYLAVDAGVLSTSSGENRRHWMEDLSLPLWHQRHDSIRKNCWPSIHKCDISKCRVKLLFPLCDKQVG